MSSSTRSSLLHSSSSLRSSFQHLSSSSTTRCSALRDPKVATMAASTIAPVIAPTTTTRELVREKTFIREPPVVDVHAFWDYQQMFASQRAEVTTPVELKLLEGSLPKDLTGSYYLCGPGIMSDDQGSSVSPFDGHGYLRKFSFSRASAVHYSARYVRTEAFCEEFDETSQSWNFKYRGPFSLLSHGHRIGNLKVMKNVANTSVLKWGGKLFCLWEGGEPYEMDPETLETIGPYKLPFHKMPQDTSSSLQNQAALDLCSRALLPILTGGFRMPEERVLAHIKIDEKRQRLVVITSNAEDMLLPKATFNVYEFNTELELVQHRQFQLQDHLLVHDWALTDEHYIILGNRIALDLPSSLTAVAGLSPMISCLDVDKSTPYSPMYILPRFQSSSSRDWSVPAMVPGQLWLTHTANAYEETSQGGKRTKFVLDATVSSYEWFSLQNMFGYKWQQQKLDHCWMNGKASGELDAPHLVRITVDLNNVNNETKASVAPFENASFATDFPTTSSRVLGSKNSYTYVASNSGSREAMPVFPMDTITKIHGVNGKLASWYAGHRCYVGEPQFVPRRGGSEEDDGYLIFVQYSPANGHRYLVILDAKLMGKKNALVAKLEVPREYHFPLGFHGFWDDSV